MRARTLVATAALVLGTSTLAHAEPRVHDVADAPTLDAAFEIAVEDDASHTLQIDLTLADGTAACEADDERVTCSIDARGRLVVRFPVPGAPLDEDATLVEPPARELSWYVSAERENLTGHRKLDAAGHDELLELRWDLRRADGHVVDPGSYTLHIIADFVWQDWAPFPEEARWGLYGDLRTRIAVVPGSAPHAEATIEVEVTARVNPCAGDEDEKIWRVSRRHTVSLEAGRDPSPWLETWRLRDTDLDIHVVVRLYVDDILSDFVIVSGSISTCGA